MSPFPLLPRGLWFEEFEPGQFLETAGRTITEADIGKFVSLTGDFNFLHMDEVLVQSTEFGRRPAHGLLLVSNRFRAVGADWPAGWHVRCM
jgi:acyl dehydratase